MFHPNKVTPIHVPIVTYRDVYLGEGFKILLDKLLFSKESSGFSRVAIIKAVRAELGIGLVEAKSLVDALTPELLFPSSNQQ